MSRPHPAILFGIFVALIVAICGVELAKGGLYLGKHEGDTFHLLQIVFRMEDGQIPHLDFMTPIGAMAFWPIVVFLKLGFGVGHAIILSQALVAVVFLPAIWWSAQSRLSGLPAVLFGTIVIVLISALVHGEAERSVSISMHYNRWAWAITFLAILLAVLPARDTARPTLDGIFIGVALFSVVMIKVTYFGAFAPPIAIALLLNRAGRTLIVTILTGLVLAGAVTAFAGLDYWLAYLRDLLVVAASDIRPYPSGSLQTVLGAPAFLGGTLLLFLSVILLRQARFSTAGLALLLLCPGFIYVTYQNWANDPQWLMFLGVFLLAHEPGGDLRNGLGWKLRGAIRMCAAATLALASPSFFNLLYSPARHFGIDAEEYVQFLPRATAYGDLYAARVRAYRTEYRAPLAVDNPVLAAHQDIPEKVEPTVFLGEELPGCSIELGLIGWFDAIVQDLEQAGYAGGKAVFAADLFSSYWLFGDFRPLLHGAPWYYGGLPGLADADYLLVPVCPIINDIRRSILEDVEQAPVRLTELRRTDLYILYSVAPEQGTGS